VAMGFRGEYRRRPSQAQTHPARAAPQSRRKRRTSVLLPGRCHGWPRLQGSPGLSADRAWADSYEGRSCVYFTEGQKRKSHHEDTKTRRHEEKRDQLSSSNLVCGG
jgi:hypothetical protein